MQPVTQQKNASFLNKRLIQLMQEKNLTLSTLSQRAGIAIGTVQKIITDPECNPTMSSLEALCKALDVSLSYLIGHTKKPDYFTEINIPLFNWHTLAEDLSNFPSNYDSKNQYISTFCSVSEYAFALKVIENSTISIFPRETIFIFDEKKPYYDGCYVLVYLTQSKKYAFKKLIIDEPDLYIKSIHLELQEHTPVRIEKTQIIATLAQAKL